MIFLEDLNIFAKEGLRTLVFAKKTISEGEYSTHKENFDKISMSSDPNKDQLLADLFDQIETGFDFVGSSAIEDKLQEVFIGII